VDTKMGNMVSAFKALAGPAGDSCASRCSVRIAAMNQCSASHGTTHLQSRSHARAYTATRHGQPSTAPCAAALLLPRAHSLQISLSWCRPLSLSLSLSDPVRRLKSLEVRQKSTPWSPRRSSAVGQQLLGAGPGDRPSAASPAGWARPSLAAAPVVARDCGETAAAADVPSDSAAEKSDSTRARAPLFFTSPLPGPGSGGAGGGSSIARGGGECGYAEGLTGSADERRNSGGTPTSKAVRQRTCTCRENKKEERADRPTRRRCVRQKKRGK